MDGTGLCPGYAPPDLRNKSLFRSDQTILPTPHEGEIKLEIKYLKTNQSIQLLVRSLYLS